MGSRNIITVSIHLFLLFSCINHEDTDQRCPGESIKIPTVSDVSFEFCGIVMESNSKAERNIVIQSMEEYEMYVSCPENKPSIDFEINTLLAGQFLAPNQDFIVDQSVSQDCNEQYLFKVDLAKGVSASPTPINYFAIIPKIDPGSTVIFEVQYRQ